MTSAECLSLLEAEGTAQNRKIYTRHGVGEKMFGVSFAALNRMKKAIRTDHSLAEELWNSGNHDARVLATMIADPQAATVRQLNAWATECDNPVLAGELGKCVAATRLAEGRIAQWTKAKPEMTRCVAWCALGAAAATNGDIADDFFAERLGDIEERIHQQPNRVREAMNRALIAVGCRNENLRKLAVQSARKVGRVDVDHGETSCETPDAAAYIEKTWQHREQKAAARPRSKRLVK